MIVTVGPGEMFKTLAAAVAAANDGDILRVDGGTYTNDFPPVIKKSLAFQASGSRVILQSTVPAIPNGKGIIIAGGSTGYPTISFNGFDFVGAKVNDANGAGIRYQAGDLTVTNCRFYNCQNGILATPFVKQTGSVVVDRTEIDSCGAGDGQSHNLYIGYIHYFALTNSYSHDCKVGHLCKTRAENNAITNTRLYDNNGTSSYAIDCPNAGNLTVSNCIIQQGKAGQNPYLMTYGVGGATNVGRSATVTTCTIVNDATSVRLMYNAVPDDPIPFVTCQFWGVPNALASMGKGPVSVTGAVWLSARPTLPTNPPYDSAFADTEDVVMEEAPAGHMDPLLDQEDPEPDEAEC